VTDDLPPKDERFYGYKGVYHRMNMGGINDVFGKVDPETKIFGEEMFLDSAEAQIELDKIEQAMNSKPVRVNPKEKIADKYLKREREVLEYPFSVIIDRIDPNDPEYVEQKRTWEKDKAHFDYVKVFTDIIKAREERIIIEK